MLVRNLILISIILAGIGLALFTSETKTPVQENNLQNLNTEVARPTPNMEEILEELAKNIETARLKGGITPERYDEIYEKLLTLKDQRIKVAEVNTLLAKMETLSVGGRNKGNAGSDTQATVQIVEESRPSPRMNDTSTPASKLVTKPNYPISPAGYKPPSNCQGQSTEFTYSPVELNEIDHIEPQGRMSASHVTPTDHGYIINSRDRNAPKISDLRSPADGYLLSIGAFPRPNDYRLVVWHSCTVSTIYIHVYELAPEILAITGELPPGKNWEGDQGPENNRTLAIPLKAGQIIGKIKTGVDFSVHDTSSVLPGFVTPSLYYGEPWKIHTADMFSYFIEPIKSELKRKSLRTIEPVGGKIDYDIDGRLVGNWFVEGTDYRGAGGDSYWDSHLAIAYDNIVPSQIRISIPNSGIDDSQVCNTCFGVYGVRGNAPDPAGIGQENGLVKYELVAREFLEDSRFRGVPAGSINLDNQVLGTLLIQMEGPRRIRVEVFPKKTAVEIQGFTDRAKIYTR